MEATVTSEGLLDLPEELRQQLGLKPGGKVNVVRRADGSVVFIPHTDEDDPFAPWVSAFGPLPDGMDAVEWVRSLRDLDDE